MIGIHIGIDFGTSFTKIFVEGQGVVFSEPSVVVCDSHTGKPVAIGNEAMNMLGRLPNSLKIIYPVQDGLIADFDMSVFILTHIIEKICKGKFFKPNIIISVRANMTSLEKRTFEDILSLADASRIFLIEEPIAAAIGAGLSFNKPKGSLIVDIGGGSTDAAIITMDNISSAISIKTAGIAITDNIRHYILKKHNLEIGFASGEEIKKTVACAIFRQPEVAMICNGKDHTTSIPKSVEISSSEIYWAIHEQCLQLTDAVREIISLTEPELLNDIKAQGIILTGGGAGLYGIDTLITQKTQMETKIAKNPENCVINGLGSALGDMERLFKNGHLFSFK